MSNVPIKKRYYTWVYCRMDALYLPLCSGKPQYEKCQFKSQIPLHKDKLLQMLHFQFSNLESAAYECYETRKDFNSKPYSYIQSNIAVWPYCNIAWKGWHGNKHTLYSEPKHQFSVASLFTATVLTLMSVHTKPTKYSHTLEAASIKCSSSH